MTTREQVPSLQVITFIPEPRMVLVCNFDTGFRPPEMVKIRPVVVVSPRRHNGQTCMVVPLSTTAPEHVTECHHRLERHSLPNWFREGENWAKCDMLTTVANHRLDRVKDGRNPDGSRRYVAHMVSLDDWKAIRAGILISLGMGQFRGQLT